MRVIVNDLSFQWRMYSQEEALEKLLNFIKICREIEGGRLKKVEKLVLVDKIDVQYEIAPSCSIIKLLQRVLPLEERRYLLSILLNRGTGGMVSGSPFVCGEKKSEFTGRTARSIKKNAATFMEKGRSQVQWIWTMSMHRDC